MEQRSNRRCSDASGGCRRRIAVGMRPLRRPSWGMAEWSISHGFWRAIRKPFGTASASWRRQRMRREYEATGDAVISIDTKKKELLGNFHRAGTTFTAETVETFDHDFGSAGQGKLIPHGIYDIRNQHAHIHLNTSHDTSELCCDSVALWWEHTGRAAHPQAKRLLVLGDGGGSK